MRAHFRCATCGDKGFVPSSPWLNMKRQELLDAGKIKNHYDLFVLVIDASAHGCRGGKPAGFLLGPDGIVQRGSAG